MAILSHRRLCHPGLWVSYEGLHLSEEVTSMP